MKFKAEIEIMPHDALLDPQGKAVSNSMKNIGLVGIENVRIGKHIRVFIEAKNEDDAKKSVEEACQKMLVNKIMETYRYNIESIS